MVDVGYFLRCTSLAIRHRGKNEARNIFDNYVIHGRCWPSDLDFLFHMNNSRYLRQCDFGRFAFLLQSGLWNSLQRKKLEGMKNASFLISATQSQYRQSIALGDRFSIITRTCGWDDNAFYLEHQMVRDKNRQTAFSLLVRFAIAPREIKPQMLVDDIYKGSVQSPSLPAHARHLQENYRLSFPLTCNEF